MKRLLIVSHVLPPSFMGGTPRLLRWCKLLPELGWQVTLAGFSDDPLYTKQDPLPAGVEVISIPYEKSKRGVFSKIAGRLSPKTETPFPDRFAPRVMDLAEAIAKAEQDFDLVMVSAPSFSLLEEEFLAAIKTSVQAPMLLDLRDPFSENEAILPEADKHEAAKIIERAAARYFDGVVSISSLLTKKTREWFPEISKRATVRNAFDREAYLPLRSDTAWPNRGEGVLRLTYTGHCYGTGAPALLIPGVRMAIAKRPELAEALRVEIVGRGEDAAIGDWAEWPGMLELKEPIPYRDIPALLCRSDVLLVVIGDGPLADGVPGAKVIEYLGARRPIFCVARGAASRIVMRTETGLVASPNSAKQVCDALLHLHDCWLEDEAIVINDESRADRFEARAVAKELVDFCGTLLEA